MLVIASSIITFSNVHVFANSNEYDYDLTIESIDTLETVQTFDFANALAEKDAQHAYELIQEYINANPNATDEQILVHLKSLIESDTIRIANTTYSTNWPGYVPTQLASLGENATEVFNSNPVRGLAALNSGWIANNRTSARWSGSLHNDNGDAFRHAFWNLHMMFNVGNASFVERFATAWEDDGTANGQPDIERRMDLFNNQVGRNLARRVAGNDPNWNTTTELVAMQATENGDLQRIVNNRLVSSNSNGKR